MKLLSTFRFTYLNRRGTTTFRSLVDGSFIPKPSPSSIFWLAIHSLCCLISLILGFRFSHVLLFFLSSTSFTTPEVNLSHLLQVKPNVTITNSRVTVGRHGIRIRPWPHPNPTEVVKAHQLLKRVQNEQKSLHGVTNPKTVIAVTPTYVRTFQALHLTGVMHSLMLVPYDVVWIVVEAGGKSNETASFIKKSGLKTIHLGFEEKMVDTWEGRRRLESKMRIKALKVVRDEKLDGVVVFVDDSNMHSMEFFDEVQSVRWFGAVSVGILLARSGNELSMVPIQGPSCDSSGKVVGWHVFDTKPYGTNGKGGVMKMMMGSKMEWAGFVLNSRLVWEEGGGDDRPSWVKDVDKLLDGDEGVDDGVLSLVKDASMVEPLGSCGRRVLLWWLRVEARADSKFPPGWIIKSPLDITVASKKTPWSDSSSKLPVVTKETKNSKPRGSKGKSSKGT
ncbi:unnamed protein product [Eruca vesicaria subsp. sativa]|uniref:Glycosyltransferases n=1 Tax=Eruca vesicaria subsp. sativa TaxID=29727 RepID=A0ABC8JNQ7_ERUVS|nr:unnamed protein product [Eruca vesicaria subsp. sativa]